MPVWGADGSDLDIDLDDASAALAGVRARAAGEPPCVMKLVQVCVYLCVLIKAKGHRMVEWATVT
eukprot:1151785-Pelagomonas_calceolata.AAC.3